MRKFTELEIANAYLEFASDKEWVSGNAHEMIAYDFLLQNQYLDEFFAHRDIHYMHLYYCLKRLSDFEDKKKRHKAIQSYCQEQEIFFTKYDTLDYIFDIASLPSFKSNEQILASAPKREFYKQEQDCVEHPEIIIEKLNRQLLSAKKNHIPFGLMEYYSYYHMDILELKHYLDQLESFMPEYERVSRFIEPFYLLEQLETVSVDEIFHSRPEKKVIHNLYFNDERLKKVVGRLSLMGYPIMTGTINIALSMYEKGTLEELSKQKVKKMFEGRIKV